MILWFALVACGGPAEPAPVPGEWSPTELARLTSLRLDVTPRPDPTNAHADDPQAARLGQTLFYDAGLSPSGKVACATCHQPEHLFTDDKPLGTGLGTTRRHVPGIVGNQWGAWFFWDGRVDSLWAQALGPIESPVEMGGDRTNLARYVLTVDGEAYSRIWPDPPDFSDKSRFPEHAKPGNDVPELDTAWNAMTPEDRDAVNRVASNVAKAIAAYERRIVPEPSRFDRYVDAVVAGDPLGAGRLDEAEIRGLSLFLRDGCTNCHTGPMFTDRAFHNLGLPEPAVGYDPGRQEGAALVKASEFDCASPYSDTQDCPELRYLNPQFPDFQAAFKTPSLRYVAETAPYGHNGVFPRLEDVLRFYSTLPGDPPAGHRELTLKPLNLDDAQIADMVAFLGSLTGYPLPPDVIGLPIQ